jgi:hypothetical protein
MGGIFKDTPGGTWVDSDGGKWVSSAESIQWIVKEDGSGDFTSVVTALADPVLSDDIEIQIQGPWVNPDAGLVSGTATFYNDDATVTAVGESRYPGYPVESPTHWRARKTDTTNYSFVFALANKSAVLDGLDIVHDGQYAGRQFRCIDAGANPTNTVTIKNCALHKGATSTNETVLGYVAYLSRTGHVATIENSQFSGLSNVAVLVTVDTGHESTLNINSSTIVKNTYGISHFGAGGLTVNLLNSIIAGNTGDDIYVTGAGDFILDAHNSIDLDGSLGTYDGSAHGCITATAVTDSDEPEEGDLVFRNITTLPYDLRLKKYSENCCEMFDCLLDKKMNV